MTRIFRIIASLNALLLLVSFGSGIVSWLQRGNERDAPVYIVHFVLGLTTALTTLFVHCLVLTYFLGTGRWLKEVCLAYGMPDEGAPRQTRDIKRRNTPRILLAMTVTVAAAAAGMAAQQRAWPGWIHLLLAVFTIAVNVYVFVVEYGNVRLNGRLLDTVVAEVERIRAERGLPSSEEALRESN
jgi:hypothetical protein